MKTKIKSPKKSTKKISVKNLLNDVSPWDGIPMVDSLKDVKPYQVVRTTNYKLIKANPLNRYDKKRVDGFVKLINNGDFYEKSTIVKVDYLTHMLNDDHHKVMAMEKTETPVVFMLCDLGNEFRGEFSMESIAKLNNSNSAWTAKDKFDQAKEAGYMVATILSSFKNRIDKAEPTNNFRPWNLLNFALGKNCESGVAIEDYRNNDIVELLTSKIFEDDFKALVSVIGKLALMDLAVRPSDVLKRLSVLNGSGKISIIEFASKFDLHYKTFKPAGKNKDYLDAAIKSIIRKRG